MADSVFNERFVSFCLRLFSPCSCSVFTVRAGVLGAGRQRAGSLRGGGQTRVQGYTSPDDCRRNTVLVLVISSVLTENIFYDLCNIRNNKAEIVVVSDMRFMTYSLRRGIPLLRLFNLIILCQHSRAVE